MATTYDSLIIANHIELLGGPGGVPSQLPECLGATFNLQPGFNLGAPQPTTDFVASLIIDGERPFGRRASDRTITLPLQIHAPDFATLAGACEVLLETIDQQYWTLTWTRATTGTSLPLVLDCFRAQPSVITWGGADEYFNTPIAALTITFQALPYGRSDLQTQIGFAAPVPSLNPPPTPPAPVLLDGFATINSPQCAQSFQCVLGPYSCYWDPTGFPAFQPFGSGTPLTYGAMFAAPVNLASMTALDFWLGLGSRYYTNLEYRGKTKIKVAFTLTDVNGVTLGFSTATVKVPVSQSPTNPAWYLVSTHIPQGSITFNYSAVASYSITIWNRAPTFDNEFGEFKWVVAYLDSLIAHPSSVVAAAPSVRGSVYTLHGVAGTSHAPVSLQFQQAAVAGSPTTISAAGAGSYTVPGGTVYLKVEAVGGGGAGASQSVSGVGGGGGGGEDAQEPVFPATPGQVIPYSVGAGGTAGASPVNGQNTVFGPAPASSLALVANGGMSVAQNSTAGGLGGTGSTNAVHYNGGLGRTASGSVGGGGGSSAGSSSAGNTPTGTANVVLTGSGNWTAPAGVTQITVYGTGGGGGGGSGSSTNNGAGGGGGEVAEQIFTVIPGNNYAYVVGAGGAGGTASGNAGSNGAATTFTVAAATLTAHGGTGGPSSSHSLSGGLGGTGSTATTHFNGGQGGNNSPYTGGGGSSAGTSSAGNAGNGYGQAGVAPSGGGAGGNGSGPSNGVGQAGVVPGGGGGGSYNATYAGGAGAAGTIVISYPGGAPTNNGATAVAGGGAGGAGGGSANTAGTAGSAPGGAGGGADSTGTSEAGGAGAAGHLVITPFASPAFKTLIVHRPGPDAPPLLNPFVAVGGGVVAPGSTEYPVQSLVVPATLNDNAAFAGTVTPWTAANSATLSYSTVWQAAGSALFHGSGSVANPQMLSENNTPVVAGNSYTFSPLLYSPQGFASCQVGIIWLEADDVTQIGSTIFGNSTNVAAGVTAGTTVSVTAVAPTGATFAQIVVQMTGTPAVTVLMYVDNAALTNTPQPADFAGTYSIVLINDTWNSPSSARTISVTVKQYEYIGGSSYSTTTTPISIIPNTQVVNGIVLAGVLTLPLKALATDNLSGYFTVIVTDSNTSDRFYDCLFLDTQGQTVIINEPSSGYINYYIDEPDPIYDLGNHLGSQFGRPDAISVMDACTISGGPLTIEPGDNTLLAYCVEGAPAISVSYSPRWFLDRTS